MKLIPHKIVDDAAEEFIKIRDTIVPCDELDERYLSMGFRAGIKFAEKKLEKLAIEFAYYCAHTSWKQTGYVYGKNTEELFEQFIKEKSDKIINEEK